jgi:tetratricopeptide (TPR) repeat protein
MIAGRGPEATDAGLAGLALAEEFGDERLQARALVTLGASRNSEDDLRRGIEIADRIDAFIEFLRGNNNLGEALIQRGDLAGVDELYEAAATRVARVGWTNGLAWIDAQRSAISYATGDWATCERLLARFAALVERTEPHVLEFDVKRVAAKLAEARGDLARAEALWDAALELARAVKDPQAIGPTMAGRALFLLAQGRADEALAHAEEVLGLRDEQGRASYFTWLIDLGWLLHDLGRAHEFPEARHEGVWAASGLAIANGDFAAAADLLAAADLRTDEAYARLRAGERLADEGRSAEAAAQRDRALAFYRAVEATPYLRRAEALFAESA